MMRRVLLASACAAGALLAIAPRGATAQNPLTRATRSAKKAAAATSAHIEAEQHPEGTPGAVARTASAGPETTRPAAPRTAPASGQAAHDSAAAPDTAAPPPVIYRETFAYQAGGRRDPFNSLLTTDELRPAISDLRLTGVLVDHSGRHSVATLRDLGTNEQYRVTLGSTLGRMRVSAIRRTTVVFTIDEYGMTRQDSLVLRDTTNARGK